MTDRHVNAFGICYRVTEAEYELGSRIARECSGWAKDPEEWAEERWEHDREDHKLTIGVLRVFDSKAGHCKDCNTCLPWSDLNDAELCVGCRPSETDD